MIEIPLTQGKVAIVDDCDAHLAAFRWHAKRDKGGLWYAARCVRDAPSARQRHERLHRVILGVTDRTVEVDHANGDGLDCRRGNLRTASHPQNGANRTLQSNNKSGFRGVSRHGERRWQAKLKVRGTWRSLGRFASAEEAARAYDAAAIEAFGEFARLNFPSPSTPETKDDHR